MRHCGIRLQFNYRNSIIHSFVPADLQSPSLLLHHLVRIGLPILHGDAQGVGARRQLAHVDAFEGIALRAHQAA